jgi:hypothetical protein
MDSMESRSVMTFTPDRSNIIAITQSNPAVVTTGQDHGLFDGGVVRLVVPKNFGMFALNGMQVQIIRLSSTTFSCYISLVPTVITVNTTFFPAFVIPTMPGLLASVLPIGQGPTPQENLAWQINSGYCESPLDDAVLNNSTVEIPF